MALGQALTDRGGLVSCIKYVSKVQSSVELNKMAGVGRQMVSGRVGMEEAGGVTGATVFTDKKARCDSEC